MSMWAPANKDTSISILQQFLTGGMPFSLHDTSITLFQQIIYGFNIGMLSIGMVLFGYILVAGTIHSARDGVFLGKDWDSYWLPLRTVFGAIAVIPTKSGYCMAQWAIFNLVSMGVGFADHIWQDAYTAASQGSQAVIPSGLSQQIIDQNAYFLLHGFVINAYAAAQKEKVLNCPSSSDKTLQMTLAANGDSQPLKKCHFSYDVSLNNVDKSNINQLLDVWQPDDQQHANLPDFLPQDSGGMSNFLVNNFSQCIQLGNSICGVMLNDGNSQLNYYQLGLGDMTVNADYLLKANSQDQYLDTYQDEMGKTHLKIATQAQFTAQLKSLTTDSPFAKMDIFTPNSTDAKLLSIYSGDTIKAIDKHKTPKQSTNKIKSTWWDADQKYLFLDQMLQKNIQALQQAFSQISKKMQITSSDTQIASIVSHIDLQKIPTQTIVSNTALKPDSNGVYNINGSSELPQSTPESSDVLKGKANVTQENAPDLWKLIASGQLQAGSIQSTLDFIGKVFGQSSDWYTLAKESINNGLSAKAQSYIQMVMSIAEPLYKQNQQEAQNLLINLINLMTYFQINDVSFIQSSNNMNDNTSDVAKDAVTAILNKLFKTQNASSNQAKNSVISILDEIYKFGESKNNGGYTQGSYIQQLQNLGRDMINRALNAYQNTYQYFASQLGDLQNAQKRAAWASFGLNTGALTLGTAGAATSAFAIFNNEPGFVGMALQGTGKLLQGTASLTMQTQTAISVMSLYSLMLQLMYLPILFVILSLIFINGIMFSLVLPLAPFFFFWAGKIAWLLLVVEAFVAAPFVALGMVYPEGHQVFGKSQPGIQMAVNLFFRPVLMVIGLVTSVILTYIVVKYSVQAFHGIVSSMNLIAVDYTATDNISSGVIALFTIFVFVSFLAIAFNKCFSIIYLLPDKVLQWVGHSGGERAGEQEFQQIKSGTESGAQQASQAGQKSADEGLSARKGHVMESGKAISGVGEAATGTLGGDSNAKLASSYAKQKRKHDDENGANDNYEQKK
ncbi:MULTISPECIES: DotA/TraY family protein [Cysteiniphilum]|uniref:DotA/TraY family protein n=1 Tax=Cysteiniphilum TaxID=2056696 RepID=UPI0017846D9B|nr:MULTISPECIES: DotA/TraY family protein [Cysteiniphilum]